MDQLPGEDLLKKMWETLADKGIAGWLKPWQIRRVGRAITDVRTDTMLRIAQAEREVAAIKSGAALLENGGTTLKITYTPDSASSAPTENKASSVPFLKAIEASQMAETARKEINVAKAIMHAEATLENDSDPVNTGAIDSDWLFRWRDFAGEVSNEELQNLWGKILAGEVKTPGSFSLRTLEFLRNTSKTDAERIARLAPFILQNRLYRGNDDYLKDKGISYGFLLKMQELGILSGVEALGLEAKYSSTKTDSYLNSLLSVDKALVVQHEDPTKILKVRCCILTSVGIELMKLCSAPADEEYLRKVGADILKQGFSVTLAPYKLIFDDKIRFYDAEVLKETEPTQ